MGFYKNDATAASNTSVNGIAIAGSSSPANIDNALRELTAQGKQFALDLGGATTVAGTADAIAITLNDSVADAYFDGMLITFIAGADNTVTGPTANVNAIGAKTIKKALATDGAEAALAIGDIQSGGVYMLRYRSAWASAAGAWQLIDLQHPVDSSLTLIDEDDMASDSDTAVPSQQSVKAYVDANAGTSVPVGTVVDYAGASAPSLWLLCYGQAVSRTTYADLFTAISTTYGVGDGSTTFNLPDLRGRVVAGKDDMGGSSANRLTDQSGGLDGDVLGDTGGAETHTLTEAQMPAHTHTITGGGSSGDTPTGTATSANGADQSGSTGGGGAHNNVQPTIILNKIIYAGV